MAALRSAPRNTQYAAFRARDGQQFPMPPKPPTGTVTFLFTDIVGSTEMWEQHGDAFLPVLQAHNAILADAIARYGGYLVKTEGDAYTAAFADPTAAAHCAILAHAVPRRDPSPPQTGP